MDLIGEEHTFGRVLDNVRDNYDVFILNQAIRVNQKFKITGTKTGSFGIDQVCCIQHLIENRILIRALSYVGSTSQVVGAGASKVAVLGLGCNRTNDELRGH